MAVKRLHRLYFVECDTCGEVCDDDGDNFQEAVDVFKTAGGRVYRDDDGDWRHACADCRSL